MACFLLWIFIHKFISFSVVGPLTKEDVLNMQIKLCPFAGSMQPVGEGGGDDQCRCRPPGEPGEEHAEEDPEN